MTPQKNPSNPADELARLRTRAIMLKLRAKKELSEQDVAFLMAKARGIEPQPAVVSSIVLLAQALHVTRQCIHRWLHRPSCPGRRSNGEFVVADWQKWRADNMAVEDDSPTAGQALGLLKMELETRRLFLEVQALEAGHIPVAEIATNLREMITALAFVTRRLPALAPQLHGRDVAQIRGTLETEARSILETLSGTHWSALAAQARAQDTAAAPPPVTEQASAPPPASYEHPEAFELKELATVEPDPTPAPTPATGAV